MEPEELISGEHVVTSLECLIEEEKSCYYRNARSEFCSLA